MMAAAIAPPLLLDLDAGGDAGGPPAIHADMSSWGARKNGWTETDGSIDGSMDPSIDPSMPAAILRYMQMLVGVFVRASDGYITECSDTGRVQCWVTALGSGGVQCLSTGRLQHCAIYFHAPTVLQDYNTLILQRFNAT